jgi:oxaloacetate decarboxylase alpha subunit
MSQIRYVDQTLRDGQQSHWGMRMQAGHMLAVADAIDAAGYHAIDLTGSSHFEVLVRYQRENPWDGLDAMRAAMPNATLRAGMRVNGVVGMGISADSVIELWVRTLGRHGIGSVWIMDCLHDVEKMTAVARMARSHGVAPSPQINFSQSPVHTDAYYAKVMEGLVTEPAIESIILGDEAGVLSVERARTWIPLMKAAAGDVPLELHFHSSTGQATINHLIGVECGIEILHTAVSSMANGPSMPSTQVSVDNVRRLGHTVAIDDSRLDDVSDHFAAMARREGWATGAPVEYRLSVAQSQFPGGMMGTLRDQLARNGMSDRMPELLEEAIRVRAEMGYPIMATPFSQLVGIQALLNLVNPERYGVIPEENLMYLAGWYGPAPGPIDPALLERAWSTPRGREIRDGSPPQPPIEELREHFDPHLSDEEFLLRHLINDVDVDAMLAAGREIRAFVPAGEAEWVADLLRRPGGARSITATLDGLQISLRR